ncbi:MAG: hypothetical protein DRQ65_05470 [Gammaproteobacteria bacterium]|nr:MAG: hypothetical protein DRQ65_05470 [Gammaproteobacteria bacterium]RLA56278.1 MAG: hypothetical protein DRQ98_02665 [Gammaproteobacteria bacterium]HDY81580.1 hypothetical protein [Halieaceae bacterium]
MGEILKFPSQQAQGLAFLDRQLRTLLAAKGADELLIDFATSQLTQIYAQFSESEQYSFSVELPKSSDREERDRLYQQINTGLEGIRKENHALMVKLIAQLVLAEVRLFQHERSE